MRILSPAILVAAVPLAAAGSLICASTRPVVACAAPPNGGSTGVRVIRQLASVGTPVGVAAVNGRSDLAPHGRGQRAPTRLPRGLEATTGRTHWLEFSSPDGPTTDVLVVLPGSCI